MELDQIKQRVRLRASSGRKQSMKSRVAILGMLVTGMVFSTAGAGLALNGTSPHHNASVAQYSTVTPTPTPTCTETPSGGTSPAQTTPTCTPTPSGGVLPAESGNGPSGTSGGGSTPSGGTAPAEASNTQPTRQEAAATTTSQLPFTGFAAIPVILGGLALLAGGLILRRRTNL
jgi:hypothetical protein